MESTEEKRFKMLKGKKSRGLLLEGMVGDGILSPGGNMEKLCEKSSNSFKKSPMVQTRLISRKIYAKCSL